MTTTEKPYRPRLSIEISQQQADDLRNCVEWGLKNKLFSLLIDDVIENVRKHGTIFIAALLNRRIKLNKEAKLEVVSDDNYQ